MEETKNNKIKLNIILSSGRNIIIEIIDQISSPSSSPSIDQISIPFIITELKKIDNSLLSINELIQQNITVNILFDDQIITYNFNKIIKSKYNDNIDIAYNKHKLLQNYIKSKIDTNNFVIDFQIIYCYENH
jgi:uncharacterized membrane protein